MIAKIPGHANTTKTSEWLTSTPALAIPKALQQAGLSMRKIDCFEINETYVAVMQPQSAMKMVESQQLF
ncbi:hypothetical protein [Flavobacterium sp. Root420]|uniref:hypothetical protein n=1 Tax=Flavobacterium sp. Root420 TaxID=1736533 RepID=UPI0006F946CC|nr:hypothetical protein [Flavobacterium sp. Root420]KQX00797.1 hypothetical protein ASC72_08025 [Flavobacterium sp. Root420]